MYHHASGLSLVDPRDASCLMDVALNPPLRELQAEGWPAAGQAGRCLTPLGATGSGPLYHSLMVAWRLSADAD